MYRSIFEICILFFPQKQSRFSFKPPFSHRCRGEPCLPAAQTTAALFRKGSPHGKRAQAHTLRPCNPRMPVPFPQSRLSFKKKSCPLRILRMAQDAPPIPTYFHKKCFSFLLPSPANQLSFPPKPTFFQLIFMKLCRLSDEEKSGFP